MSHPYHDHSSAHTTLRWGDTETIVGGLNAPSTTEGSGQAASKQLIAAHWRWPITWNCQFILIPSLPGETQVFTVDLNIIIGVGQAMMGFDKLYTLTRTAGVYLPIMDNFQLPAQDIQAKVFVNAQGAQTGTHNSIQVGMFVAPMTEPHAMTMVLEELARGNSPDQARWMMEGFEPSPLAYRR